MSAFPLVLWCGIISGRAGGFPVISMLLLTTKFGKAQCFIKPKELVPSGGLILISLKINVLYALDANCIIRQET